MKDIVDLVLGDTDSGVGHCEPQAGEMIRLLHRTDVELDPALLCKLQGVGQKVLEHLSEPVRITVHIPGHISGNKEPEADLFLPCLHFKLSNNAFQHLPQVEVLGVQFQFALLDPGEVQQVVQKREYRARGIAYQLQVSPGLVRQFLLQEHVGHTQDPCNGRADLMAHVGQKLVLGPVCLFQLKSPLPDTHLQPCCQPFGFFLGLFEFLFQTFALRYIKRDPDHPGDPPVTVTIRAFYGKEDHTAVRCVGDLLKDLRRFRFHHQPVIVHVVLTDPCLVYLPGRPADDFGFLLAQHPQERRRGHYYPPLQILGIHNGMLQFTESGKKCVGLPKFLLYPLAIGDVVCQNRDPKHFVVNSDREP